MSDERRDATETAVKTDPLEERVAMLEEKIAALERLLIQTDPLEAGHDEFLGRIAARKRFAGTGGFR